MPTPLVSILIPLYNAELWIAETLDCALGQDYANVEIVVVDDHSTDASLGIVQRYEAQHADKIRVYTNPRKGGNAARNYAFQQSKGEYVKFLDADDLFSAGLIARQVERLLSDGTKMSVATATLQMLYPDGRKPLPCKQIERDYAPGIELQIDIFRRRGFFVPHAHLMHRELVENVGGWDEAVIKNQDGEFFARVYIAADRVLCVPGEIAIWRQTGTGVSSQLDFEATRSVFQTYVKIFPLVLAYRSDSETRRELSLYASTFLWQNYPTSRPLLEYALAVFSRLRLALLSPPRRTLTLAVALFGWPKAAYLFNKILRRWQ